MAALSSSSSLPSPFPAFFSSFVESCVHCYLHARGLYPDQVFERRRFHSRAIQVARHPDVCDYVSGVTRAFLALLQSRPAAPHKLALVLYDPDSRRCLERLVFDVRARVPLSALRVAADVSATMAEAVGKFAFLDSVFVRPTAGVAWRALIYSNDRAPSAEWCSVDRTAMIEVRAPLIFPIKSVRATDLELEVYAEAADTIR